MVQILVEIFEEDEYLLLPCYVIGRESNLVPIFNGHDIIEGKTFKDGFYGIFVRDIDYNQIDFSEPLILIHDAEPKTEEIQNFVDTVEIEEGVDHIHVYKRRDEAICNTFKKGVLH